MLRLIGILTGSALAVGFLIIALGVPEFSPDADLAPAVADGSSPHEAIDAPEPVAPEPVITEPAPVEETTLAAETGAEAEAETMPDAETLIDEIFAPGPAVIVEDNWYAFWSPFRSEIAANGFISKLQETTGIDYRVVKVKTGVYEVAFAYTDDADVQEKLARISNATGLDMTGS